MRTAYLIRICLVAASFCLVLACKKEISSSASSSDISNLQMSADDQTMASNENDVLSTEAIAALTASGSLWRIFADPNPASGASMREDGNSPICDASLSFDTTATTKTLTIEYNGTNCGGNRTRTGTIIISEPRAAHWKDAGAVVSITVHNLTITRISDGKSIVINGFKKITNTSGGLLTNLANNNPVIYDIADSLTISFDKSTARTWNVSKHDVFVYDNGIKMTTTGTHTDGANNDVAEWGTDRFGTAFSSRITVPEVITQFCGVRLIKGQDTITRGDNFIAVVTYGLTATGNPITSCAGNIYARVSWTYKPTNKTGSFIFQY